MNDITLIENHIKEQLNMERENNLKLIKKDIEENGYGGKYIYDGRKYYYITAATSTIEDYYYVALNEDREIHFISCVGKLNIQEHLPPGMETLDYVLNIDPRDIADDIKKYIKRTGSDVLFTKININGELY